MSKATARDARGGKPRLGHFPGRVRPGPPAGIGEVSIREAVTYQPASRYWAFEWTETAMYLAMAVALAGYCSWRLSRRLS